MCKFKAGNVVIGNSDATIRYKTAKKGVKLRVIECCEEVFKGINRELDIEFHSYSYDCFEYLYSLLTINDFYIGTKLKMKSREECEEIVESGLMYYNPGTCDSMPYGKIVTVGSKSLKTFKIVQEEDCEEWCYPPEWFDIYTDLKEDFESIKKNDKEIIKKEESKVMKFDMKKVFGEIGKIEDGSVALTMTGEIAFKRADGDYVRYNKETENIENQMDLVLDGVSDMIMLMPVQSVEEGDIIKNKNKYYQVTTAHKNGNLKAIDLLSGKATKIIKETNIMGMSFYSKVTNMMNMNGMKEGQFNPMMLMMMSDKDSGSDNMLEMMMMSQMMTGQTNGMQFNPMMLMMMKGDMDITKLMLMSQMGSFNMFGGKKDE